MFLSSPFLITIKQLTHPPSPPNQDPKTYIFLSDWQVVGSRSQYLVCLVLSCLGKAAFPSSTTTTATVPLSPQLANFFLPTTGNHGCNYSILATCNVQGIVDLIYSSNHVVLWRRHIILYKIRKVTYTATDVLLIYLITFHQVHKLRNFELYDKRECKS
jgi:hypothetical protein